MYRIFLVEDDPIISRIIAEELGKWGYTVQAAKDFSAVLDTFLAFAPQLVLLDLSLPFYNGYHWCQEIRKISSVPVIFISSSKDNMSLVTALHNGADDFIPKPFDLPVLVAKVQALLRRAYDFSEGGEVLSHRGAFLNLGESKLLWQDEKIELTRNELRILQCLIENKGKVVSRDALMRKLWESESFIDDNTLTVNITRLRKKLENAGLADFIITKKGQGYSTGE